MVAWWLSNCCLKNEKKKKHYIREVCRKCKVLGSLVCMWYDALSEHKKEQKVSKNTRYQGIIKLERFFFGSRPLFYTLPKEVFIQH